MNPLRMPFPWLSAFGSMLVVAWQFLLLHPGLVSSLPAARPLLNEDWLLLGLAGLALLAVYDVQRFLQAKRRYRDQLQQYREQIDELFNAKRALGTRARTYSDHADKLKMFISERLLEYIVPDFVHVLHDGKIVKSGGKELALELEDKGYDWLKN